MDKQKALDYYDTLSVILKRGKGVAKVVTGVEENIEVIPDYQLAES